MPHPYEMYEGTPLWSAIASAVSGLVENRDLEVTTAPQYVVGFLCQSLVRSGLVSPEAVTRVPPAGR